jgi:pimeloyl-ACP methyl ester carboxylesterase
MDRPTVGLSEGMMDAGRQRSPSGAAPLPTWRRLRRFRSPGFAAAPDPGGRAYAEAVEAAPNSYLRAYDAVLARWPVPVEALELTSKYGVTRVNACGPAGAPPLVLLSGGFATSTVWFANVAALCAAHRVYAVDVLCDQGRGTAAGDPITGLPELLDWLDTVFDGLGLGEAVLCGHSYGGWIALRHALHAQERLRKLILLDPTQCFAGFGPRFLWHSLPVMVRPNARRALAHLSWETDGAPLDPDWLALQAAGAESPRPKIVAGRRPTAEELRTLTIPVLLLLAGRGKAHSAARVEQRARASVADLTVRTLPNATHFTLPALHSSDLDRELLDYLA